MGTLSILIGLPGSGKTSYAKKQMINSNTIYLSSDDIRVEMFGFEDQTHNSEVFNEMNDRTYMALNKGYNVIYDATNLSRKRREQLIKKAKNEGNEVDAYLFCTPINIILERNLIRQERHLPYDKLIQMIQNIECPMYYEGFDNIYLIDGGMYNDVYDYNFLIKECKDYKQENPYHLETLEQHIVSTTKIAEELGEEIKLRIDAEILRQAARYHDFGKIYTKQFNEKKGYYVYYGHEKVSTYLYLCHIRKQCFIDEYGRVRLSDSHYQTASLILNHMEWYRNEDMSKIEKRFNDDNLFMLLQLLHIADEKGRIDKEEME